MYVYVRVPMYRTILLVSVLLTPLSPLQTFAGRILTLGLKVSIVDYRSVRTYDTREQMHIFFC